MSPARTVSTVATMRNLLGPLVRAAYPTEIWGVHHIPVTGPILIVGDQDEVLAGAIIKAAAPRPVHVIATPAAMEAVPAPLLRAAGDIPCTTPGVGAAAEALRLLAAGEAVVALGHLPAVGALAAASQAPVLPVAVLGARGRVATDPPPPRTRVAVRFGAPRILGIVGDPCALSTVRDAGERIRQMLADARTEALARQGGPMMEAEAGR